jgi:hypothetical protein
VDCARSQYYFINRHNAVRDSLKDFLVKYCQPAADYAISLEPIVTFSQEAAGLPTIDANSTAQPYLLRSAHRLRTIAAFRAERQDERRNGRYRGDVLCSSATRQQVIDVVVTNPTAPSYMLVDFRTTARGIAENQPVVGSSSSEEWIDFETDLAGMREDGAVVGQGLFSADGGAGASRAVAMREASKRSMYRGRFGDWADDPANFVPFVVEATGRLGVAADAFTKGIMAQQECLRGRTKFIRFVGAVIARQNALMAQTWARSVIASRP